MPRRVNIPAADDLFRTTGAAPGVKRRGVHAVPDDGGDAAEESQPKKPSGRVKHDEKMTVYVTADELLDIEQARLVLRREHGLAVDRGRLVREAVSLVLSDLEARGAESALVVRLCEE